MLIIQKVRIMIYSIHDRIISEKVIATSDTHTSKSILQVSFVFLLAIIVDPMDGNFTLTAKMLHFVLHHVSYAFYLLHSR